MDGHDEGTGEESGLKGDAARGGTGGQAARGTTGPTEGLPERSPDDLKLADKPAPRPMRRALIVSAILTVAFGMVAADVICAGRLTEVDSEVAQGVRDRGVDEGALASVMIALTYIGSWRGMAVITLAGVVYQVSQRRWLLALAWALIPALGALINIGVKTGVGRERPPPTWRHKAVTELNQSFPSGHAMGAVIGMGVVGYMGWLQFRRRALRWCVIGVCAAMALGIGLSRVFLRAHWLSDVMGGFLIGGAWLAFCVGWVETWRRPMQRGDGTRSK